MAPTDQNAITMIEQKTVHFYGDELIALRGNDRQIYVSLSHLCSVLNIDRRSQVRRIGEHTVMADGYILGRVQTAGGQQKMGLLRVDLVPLWLTTLDTRRVADDVREKLERYQREAAKVLWEAFQEGRLTAPTSLDELLETESPAAQAYKMAAAIMQMARQQLLLESQVDAHSAQLVEYGKRLETIEEQLGDTGQQITPAQAMEISQAVKAVAHELGKQTRRNEYGGVYGELYRRYSIPSYKALPKSKFDDALNWLNNWLQSLISDTPF